MGGSLRESRLHRILRHATAIAVTFALAISFAGIFQHDLWSPDEPREAEIGREMLLDHYSAMPRLSGEPFLEKPPLFVWAMAACYQLLGVSDGVARVPAALFSAASIVLAYFLGRRASGRLVGLYSALCLAGFFEFWSISHKSVNDTALATFVAAGHLAFLHGRLAHRAGRARAASSSFAAVGLCASLAFLTKGLVGPALAVGPPLLATAAQRDWPLFRSAMWKSGLASLVAIGAIGTPWAFALASHPGGWSNVVACVLEQAIGRVLGSAGVGPHSHLPWYYLQQGPGATMPWFLATPAIVASARLRKGSSARDVAFVGWLVLAGVVLLSIPSGKRATYLVPLLPALAVLPAAWLARARSDRRLDRVSLELCIGGAALAAAATGAIAIVALAKLLPSIDALARIERGDSTVLLIALAIASAATSALAVRAVLAFGRAPVKPRRLAPASVAPILATLALSHLLVRPALDPTKTQRAVALAVDAAIPREEPLIGFNPSETTRGIVPFYTGRLIRSISGSDPVGQALSHGARHILVNDGSFEQALLEFAGSRLRPFREIEVTPDSWIKIFECVPPDKPE